jgi:5-aminolevulinate synthase
VICAALLLAPFLSSTFVYPLRCAAVAAVRHLKTSTAERSLLHTRSAQFKRLLVRAGFPLLPSASHIVSAASLLLHVQALRCMHPVARCLQVPVFVGDATAAKAATDLLLRRHGLYVQPINYPTVPRGKERLRMTPSPFHTTEMMEVRCCVVCLLSGCSHVCAPTLRWLCSKWFRLCSPCGASSGSRSHPQR